MKKYALLFFLVITSALSAEAFNNNHFFSKQENISNSQNQNIEKIQNNNEKKYQEEPDISVAETEGIFIIKICPNKLKGELKPHYVFNLTTNEDVYKETGARLVINAGFFDPKNHQTVSYLTLDGEQILDPHNNKNLMGNIHLQPYMDKILNRSEFRIMKSGNKVKYDIVPHNEPIPEGFTLVHSIQGGPALLPILRLDEEFFVLTDKEGKIISQSASSLSKYARTLIGIKNNEIYFVIATNEHPISLPEAADILKAAGMEKAMAYDGGGSVSVDFRDTNLHIISDKDKTARKLKSFWIVTKPEEVKIDEQIYEQEQVIQNEQIQSDNDSEQIVLPIFQKFKNFLNK